MYSVLSIRKKTIVFFVCTLLTSTSVFSQNDLKDKLFHTIGFAVYSDYFASPLSKTTYPASSNNLTHYNQSTALSLGSFIYCIRYNIKEPSDNFAISLSASPALGPAISDNDGIGSFNIPFLAGAEFGAGATYNSTANIGGFFRVGLEYTKFPIINASSADYSSDLITSWIEPVISTGIRYWNKKNKLRELNIKYGFGKANDLSFVSPNDPQSLYTKRAMTLRLSWLIFLNY